MVSTSAAFVADVAASDDWDGACEDDGGDIDSGEVEEAGKSAGEIEPRPREAPRLA